MNAQSSVTPKAAQNSCDAKAAACAGSLTIDQLRDMSNAIRFLAADAVDQANSGHPGMPMGMADVATILWSKFLKFDASCPTWFDRDRFILSGGHGSMLLYAVNHLTGYKKMTMAEIRNFRQLHSLTPGHPEVMADAGIEMTTGPLGQGISSAVGFALAERILAARFGQDIINHKTYVFCGDGDLMEGISHEACSLAGHLKLSNLIVMYDDNEISIDGATSLSFTEDVLKRFEAYGWRAQRINGHDFGEIEAALSMAQNSDRPVLIACKTKIGYGAPNKQGTHGVHGSPLGAAETAAARAHMNWAHEPFTVPEDIGQLWRAAGSRAAQMQKDWHENLEKSGHKNSLAAACAVDISAQVKDILAGLKAEFATSRPKLATRAASGKVLEALVPALPQLIGGSADLTPSNNTQTKSSKVISANSAYEGQYIHYGVREFAMCAVMNGLALHGGCIPYGGTFMSFTDYCRPAIRLAALMKQRVIYVMTHDSIGLGEDGPTHQPVEHLAALRAIPNLLVLRPCDAMETLEAWEIAINNTTGPTVLALTRQALPALRAEAQENLSARGGYIISPAQATPKVVIAATGSEVSIAVEAQKMLEQENIPTQVISLPSFELFAQQNEGYRTEVLGDDRAVRIGVEAAIRMGWDGVLGSCAGFIGMKGFGESAPAEVLYQHFGITCQAIVQLAKEKLSAS